MKKFFYRLVATFWVAAILMIVGAFLVRAPLFHPFAQEYFFWAMVSTAILRTVLFIVFTVQDIWGSTNFVSTVEKKVFSTFAAFGIILRHLGGEGREDVTEALLSDFLIAELIFFAGVYYWPAVSLLMQQFAF